MRDLSLGCSNLDKCFTDDTKQICSKPCNSYCINVFRGCLAPFILFFPKQSIYSNQNLVRSYSNPIQFDDLNYFLSATTVYNLIKKGIKETDENEALIQAKVSFSDVYLFLRTLSRNSMSSLCWLVFQL